MSVFRTERGSIERFNAILPVTTPTTLATGSDRSSTVEYFRIVNTGTTTTITVRVEVWDGATAYIVRPDKALAAHEVYIDDSPIVLEKGETLRAVSSAANDIHITGLVVDGPK